jgi:hypothetical protein
MSRVLLALAADPLDGLERLIIVVALFELAGGLLLAGILFANVRRLVHGTGSGCEVDHWENLLIELLVAATCRQRPG